MFDGSHLFVVPPSLLRNWLDEIDKFIRKGTKELRRPKIVVAHGKVPLEYKDSVYEVTERVQEQDLPPRSQLQAAGLIKGDEKEITLTAGQLLHYGRNGEGEPCALPWHNVWWVVTTHRTLDMQIASMVNTTRQNRYKMIDGW